MKSDWRWRQTGWLEDAVTWIDGRLGMAGLTRTGQVEQPHLTAWATVLRIPTNQGDIYFKAIRPAYQFEVRLTEYLAQKWPASVPRLLASDPEIGWMLMQDGGSRLRELLQTEPVLEHWRPVLRDYARLQQETLEVAPELLALGVPDRRVEMLVTRFDHFLSEPDQLVCDVLSQGDVDRLLNSRPQIESYAAELGDLGIGDGLDHGDFHDGNIFLDQGDYIFFDWGDAGVTHPFFSLRTAFVSLENSLGLPEGDPIFGQLCDHYLSHWSDGASMEKLRRAYLISKPLASINAAVRWQAAIDDLHPQDREPYRTHVPSLLSEVMTYLSDLE